MEERKELKVSAIENGTVIDHIPPRSVFQVIKILKLQDCDNQILFGTNLESQKYGKKGIVKVSGLYFDPEDVNKIAIVAPTATLIEIKNFKVINKINVVIPDEVNTFVKCVNPNCITNHENVITKFKVIDKVNVKLRCQYCEKATAQGNITFN
ncbi:MAG: aspartate carbamoyltransferase regulatory subunit [Bacteroidales bacterium]|jgi:aspartate carbamoyltransferase regulatory subunit|nr:aspartate carbamoyltransferase regulatory subunit [Bacteroidales bacterium]